MCLCFTPKVNYFQAYDVIVNKFDKGNPEAWSKHAAQMQYVLVGQDVKGAPNKFLDGQGYAR